MNIGFDAKRAFQNSTGLGHYSRTLISSLANYHPDNKYYLFAPKSTAAFNTSYFKNINTVCPVQFPASVLKSIWRTYWIKKDLLKNHIDIYHGLSHEIPVGINKTGIKSVVTIHDLIFERFPEQFNLLDRFIYRNKFKYACLNANKIIAISQQTKQDIIDFYKIPEAKITVCYQSCNPAFSIALSSQEKTIVRKRYNLPNQFYLYVGSIIERKNLLTICKAIKQLKNNIPLVVIGKGKKYLQKVKKYIAEHDLQQKIIFLSQQDAAKIKSFQSSEDFPAIYQMAVAMIYPSIFEGFGIPVLEALCSGLPVITSNVSCLPETAGNAALYVSPLNEFEMANAMATITENENIRTDMIEKGLLYAQNFSAQKCADAVINVYKNL